MFRTNAKVVRDGESYCSDHTKRCPELHNNNNNNELPAFTGPRYCTPPPFETGVCDRLALRCGIRAASRDRSPCPPFSDVPPTAPRSRLRVRPADRLSLPPAKPVRAASSCVTRPRCGVEATPLDAVWHGKRHGRARTAQPRRLEERRARTGDTGCASYPPARCAARYRTSAGTGIFFLESPPFRTTCQAVNLSIHSPRVYVDMLTG